MRWKKLSAALVVAMLYAPAYGQPIVIEFAPVPVAPNPGMSPNPVPGMIMSPVRSLEEWAAIEWGRSAIDRGRAWATEHKTVVPTWKTQIVALLERNKRYPETARSRREQGVTQVFFSLDRQGRMLESRVVRSSGAS